MKSTVFKCPITAKRASLSNAEEEAPIYAPAFVEPEEDDDDLPLGWGSIRMTRWLHNPDYDRVMAERAALLAQFDEDVKNGVEGIVAEQRPLVERGLEETHPIPPEVVIEVVNYPVLSDEALMAARAAIRTAFSVPS